MAEQNTDLEPTTDLHAGPVPAAGNTPSDIMKIFNLSDDELPSSRSEEDGADTGSAPTEPAPVAAGEGGVPPAAQTPPSTPTPAPTPSPAPAPAPAPTPEPASGPSELDQLRAQVTQLTQSLVAMQQQQTQPRPAESAPSEPAQPQPSPYANVTLPPDIVQGIFGEDPNVAAQSMQRLIQSVMAFTHQNVMAEVKKVMDTTLDTRFSSYQAQTQEQQQQAQMEHDYYSAFPNHNNPQVRQLVAQAAQAKAMQLGPSYKWGPDFINAVGAEVNQQLQALAQSMGFTPQPAPAPQPNPQPQPAEQPGFPSRPAAQLGATPRASEPQSAANFIKSTLE